MHARSNVKPSAKKIFARQPPSPERALPGRKKMQKTLEIWRKLW